MSENTTPARTLEEREEIKQELVRVWKDIGPKSRGGFSEAWLELNLTIAQFKCLIFLDREGSTNQKTLAAVLGVTPPNVTGIVDRLVEQELVNRRENENNRRMQIIELTPKSRNLLTELKTTRESHLAALLDKLDIEDLTALLQGTKALQRLEVEAARQIDQNH